MELRLRRRAEKALEKALTESVRLSANAISRKKAEDTIEETEGPTALSPS